MTACPHEEANQHANSPGVVADGETICRGAYDPVHFNKSGLKMAFIRPAHLLAGELSVWRCDRDPKFGLQGAIEKLIEDKAPGQTLAKIFGAKVERVRKIAIETEPDKPGIRAFCVVDDCATSEAGDWHSEHAVIALAKHDNFAWEADGDHFTMAKEGLLAVFKQTLLWNAASVRP